MEIFYIRRDVQTWTLWKQESQEHDCAKSCVCYIGWCGLCQKFSHVHELNIHSNSIEKYNYNCGTLCTCHIAVQKQRCTWNVHVQETGGMSSEFKIVLHIVHVQGSWRVYRKSQTSHVRWFLKTSLLTWIVFYIQVFIFKIIFMARKKQTK